MSDDRDAADRLAEATGWDREDFAADDLPIPELDELASVENDSIPADELRELIEWFRGRAGRSPPNSRIAFEACADDLEQVIEEHTDE